MGVEPTVSRTRNVRPLLLAHTPMVPAISNSPDENRDEGESRKVRRNYRRVGVPTPSGGGIKSGERPNGSRSISRTGGGGGNVPGSGGGRRSSGASKTLGGWIRCPPVPSDRARLGATQSRKPAIGAVLHPAARIGSSTRNRGMIAPRGGAYPPQSATASRGRKTAHRTTSSVPADGNRRGSGRRAISDR